MLYAETALVSLKHTPGAGVASTALATCQAVGGTSPTTIRWSIPATRQHGNDIASRLTVRPMIVGNDSMLTSTTGVTVSEISAVELQLVNVTMADSGTVATCWAENAAGITHANWTIVVYERSE